MTEHEDEYEGGQPAHGEPGHVCRTIDARDAVAGMIIKPHPSEPGALIVDAWSDGVSKTAGAHILRQIADSWEADEAAAAAEDAAVERARAEIGEPPC